PLVHERVDLQVHSHRAAGAHGAQEAMAATVLVAFRGRFIERARMLRPDVAGAAEPRRILEGVEIEIDRAGPDDCHLGKVAYVGADKRTLDDSRAIFEGNADALILAGEAVEDKSGVAPRIEPLDKDGSGVREGHQLVCPAGRIDG